MIHILIACVNLINHNKQLVYNLLLTAIEAIYTPYSATFTNQFQTYIYTLVSI